MLCLIKTTVIPNAWKGFNISECFHWHHLIWSAQKAHGKGKAPEQAVDSLLLSHWGKYGATTSQFGSFISNHAAQNFWRVILSSH